MIHPRLRCLLVAAGLVLWSHAAAAQEPQDSIARWIGMPIVSVEIRIDGKPDTSAGLLTLVDIQPGERLSPEAWRRVAQRLDRVPQFEGVAVQIEERPGGVALIFDLEPRHPISALDFEGETGLAKADLERQIRERFNGLPPVARLVDVEDEVRQVLKNEGYRSATAMASIVKYHDPDRATMVVTIHAGPLTVIDSWDLNNQSSLDQARTLARLGLSQGAPFRERDLAAGLESIRQELRAKQFYTAIAQSLTPTYSADGTRVHLVITIVAGPIVELRVTPSGSLPGRLDDLIPVKRQSSVDTDLLEDAQRRIVDAWQERGYWHAQASFARTQPAPDRLVITYTIDQGMRYRIAGLDVPAALHMTATDYEVQVGLKVGAVFNPKEVAAGLDAVKALYQQQGYYNVKMAPTNEEVAGPSGREGAVVIHPNITEGPRGMVTAMPFNLGDKPIVTEADLRKRMTSKEHEPFDVAKLINDRAALSSYYENRGFLTGLVTIQPQFSRDGTEVTLSVSAREGPQIFVGDIVVVGNEHIKTDVILRALTFSIGSPYSEKARRDSQLALYNALSFRSVHITADERLPGETTTRVVISVEEASSKTFDVGPGVEGGTHPRAAVGGGVVDRVEFAPRAFISAGRRNLGGRNRAINGYARVSFKPKNAPGDPTQDGHGFGFTEYLVSGTYRDLNAFRSSTDLLVTLSSEQGIRTSYNFARRVGSLDLTHSVTPRVQLLGRYSLEWTRRFDDVIPENQQPLIDRLFPQVRLSIFSGAAIWDRRNNRLNATSGEQISANMELAAQRLGSEVGFVKSFFEGSYFYPVVRDRVTLATRGQLGLARGFQRIALDANGKPVLDPNGNVQVITDLPASERFFAGGTNSVRGFQLDRLGVREILTDEDLSTGGNALIVLNAELRVRVGQFLKRDLTVVGFADSGNVFHRVSDLDLSLVRTAVGFGIRYDSWIGPLRLDFGFKTNQMPFPNAIERRWEFHLSIGEIF